MMNLIQVIRFLVTCFEKYIEIVVLDTIISVILSYQGFRSDRSTHD